MNNKLTVKHSIILGLCMSLAYSGSYVAKNILSGIMPVLVTNKIFSMASLGAMGSAFFFAYGIGQLINGIAGDILSPKLMVFAGLAGGSITVVLFPSIGSVAAGTILWVFCGFFCSMLWGSLSKITAENTEVKTARVLMLCLTAASIIGNMLALFFSAISTNNWKFAFYISSIYMAISCIVWYFVITVMERKKLITYKRKRDKVLEGQVGESLTFNYLLSRAIFSVIICVMLNGIIRNAANFWIPTYITEVFKLSPSVSSIIVLIVPILNLTGTIITYKMLPLFKDNEHALSAFLFAFASLMFMLMRLFGHNLYISLISMFLAGGAMSGVCNLLFSVYVLRYSKTGRTSSIAGFLDFMAYITSAFANILIGKWANAYGWDFVITGWLLVTLAGVFFGYISNRIIKKWQYQQL